MQKKQLQISRFILTDYILFPTISTNYFSKLLFSFPSFLACRIIHNLSHIPTENVIVDTNEDINRLLPFLDLQYQEFKSKDWKVLEPAGDYTTFYFDEKSGFRSIKAEAVIKAPFSMVYNLMSNLKERHKWDLMFDSGKTLKVVKENVVVQYMKYKGKYVYSPRDFVMLIHRKTVRGVFITK